MGSSYVGEGSQLNAFEQLEDEVYNKVVKEHGEVNPDDPDQVDEIFNQLIKEKLVAKRGKGRNSQKRSQSPDNPKHRILDSLKESPKFRKTFQTARGPPELPDRPSTNKGASPQSGKF